MRRGVRVVGVGSPHGDDRVGWRLVEGLGPVGRTGRGGGSGAPSRWACSITWTAARP